MVVGLLAVIARGLARAPVEPLGEMRGLLEPEVVADLLDRDGNRLEAAQRGLLAEFFPILAGGHAELAVEQAVKMGATQAAFTLQLVRGKTVLHGTLTDALHGAQQPVVALDGLRQAAAERDPHR